MSLSRAVQLVVVLIFGLTATTAAADKVCILSTLTKTKKIKNKAFVVGDNEKCPKRAAVFLEPTQVTSLITSSILSNDGQVMVIQGAPGPTGAVGPTGATGPQGPAGTSAEDLLITVSKVSPVNSNSPKLDHVDCPSGYTAIGGNVSVISGLFAYYDGPIRVSYATPNLTGGSFDVHAVESTATSDSWGLFIVGNCRKKF